jgi:hypothetical protein
LSNILYFGILDLCSIQSMVELLICYCILQVVYHLDHLGEYVNVLDASIFSVDQFVLDLHDHGLFGARPT